MKHGRKDYNRIADPAANAALVTSYDDAMRVVARGPMHSASGLTIVATTTSTREQREAIEQVRTFVRALVDERDALLRKLSELTRALHPTMSVFCGLDAVSLPGLPIPADEPVFVLRARDMNAPEAVRQWARITEKRGGASVAVVRSALDHADEMARYGRLHGAHAADLPPETTA